MSRNISFSDVLGESISNSSSPTSFNVSTASIPSPATPDHGKDTKEVPDPPELLEWLKEFGFDVDNIDKQTLRIICRGPFKDFLHSFCLPYVRPDTWITTMRLNLDLIADKRSLAEDTNKEDLAKVKAEIKQARRELEELEQTEEHLIQKLKKKYVYVEESEMHSRILPKETKIKKEGEKKYLESLKESTELRSKLLQSLSCVNQRNDDGIQAVDGLEQFNDLESIQEFRSAVCKLIPKSIGDENNISATEDCTENIKKLKQTVLRALIKLNFMNEGHLHEMSTDVSLATIFKLPVNEFSTGLSEFNKIICDKLLGWSEAHIALHEANYNDYDGSFETSESLCSTTMESSLHEYYDYMDETAYLKLLIEEDKGLETFGFYQALNLEDYENLMAAKSSDVNGGNASNTLNNSSSAPASVFPSPLLNYELLTEKLLNSLPIVREEIEEEMRWAKTTFEGAINQQFETALGLAAEELIFKQLIN